MKRLAAQEKKIVATKLCQHLHLVLCDCSIGLKIEDCSPVFKAMYFTYIKAPQVFVAGVNSHIKKMPDLTSN